MALTDTIKAAKESGEGGIEARQRHDQGTLPRGLRRARDGVAPTPRYNGSLMFH
ncbi:hypothetical protein [Paraburkholderia sp. J41]|uniref:hypothetical protein n=1 Tax=Paraburkholderia sp. J41 TaxID=2805433 RepID=UPI002AC33D08|nr:hypothetical protein [Paraburkholderia sp. J41]